MSGKPEQWDSTQNHDREAKLISGVLSQDIAHHIRSARFFAGLGLASAAVPLTLSFTRPEDPHIYETGAAGSAITLLSVYKTHQHRIHLSRLLEIQNQHDFGSDASHMRAVIVWLSDIAPPESQVLSVRLAQLKRLQDDFFRRVLHLSTMNGPARRDSWYILDEDLKTLQHMRVHLTGDSNAARLVFENVVSSDARPNVLQREAGKMLTYIDHELLSPASVRHDRDFIARVAEGKANLNAVTFFDLCAHMGTVRNASFKNFERNY